MQGAYRTQRYRERLVDAGFAEGLPRLDRRYQLEVTWTVFPWEVLGVTMGYQLERRRSNEPDEGYVAHQVGLWFTRRW